MSHDHYNGKQHTLSTVSVLREDMKQACHTTALESTSEEGHFIRTFCERKLGCRGGHFQLPQVECHRISN